jgi:hypothetical protein
VAPESEAGVGCRSLATVLGALVGFATGAAVTGLALIGNEACVATCERVGFVAYAAGLPVSAAFSLAGGSDLVVAFFTDIILWMVVAYFLARLIERRRLGALRLVLGTVAVAVLYGALVSLGLERA